MTRSEPGATETASRLAALGYEPLVEPVFAIVALDVALPAFDALAFTSANGVRAFAALDTTRDIPVYAVGARTADVAREKGFTDVASADGDAAALAKLILTRLPPGAVLLHAGNEETRGDLAGVLQASGVKASHVALYRAAPAPDAGQALADHLCGAASLDAVLVHSPRGAAILAEQVARHATRHIPTPQSAARTPLPALATISKAALTPLEHHAARHAIAREPTEDALLEALQSLIRP